jgi:hypothetical protein
MKPTEIVPFTQWAEIHRTEKFVSVEPLSGYRRALPEDDGRVVYLPPDATDSALGQTLLEALDRSRFIWPPDERGFFGAERYMRCYRNWLKDLMRRYGYKTKRDAFNNMDWCRAERTGGKIFIQPHRRDKPEYWSDLPPDRTVIIPATADAAMVGVALRRALDRCE